MQKLMVVKRSLIGTLILFFFLVVQIGQASPIVRMETSEGSFSVELYDWAAPQTAKNFLRYVNAGRYDNTFIHRSMTLDPDGFSIIQGGGYTYDGSGWTSGVTGVTSFGAVDAEISLSNLAGTIAMANSGSPYSSGSQWYFNVIDNSATFDGRYSVFGEIFGADLPVIDSINSINAFDKGGNFQAIPLVSYSGVAADPAIANLIWVNRAYDDVNNDQTPDSEQGHIGSIWNRYDNFISLIGQPGTTLTISELVDELDLSTLPVSLLPLAGQEIDSSLQAQAIQVDGVISADGGVTPGSTTITVILPEGTNPISYYIYGTTPDDATDHWYAFDYDDVSKTGAVITGNVVTLYLVDGERGDANPGITDESVIINTGAVIQFLKVVTYSNSYGEADSVSSPGGTGMIVSDVDASPFIPELESAYPEALVVSENQITEFIAQNIQISGIVPDEEIISVTITYPTGVNPDSFYMYGPTPDNLSNHWYKFDYDRTTKTGAIIDDNVVTLYLVNNERGDISFVGVNSLIEVGIGGIVRYLDDLNEDGIADRDQQVLEYQGSTYIWSDDTTTVAVDVVEEVIALASFEVLPLEGGQITTDFFKGIQSVNISLPEGVSEATVSIVLSEGDSPSFYYIYGPTADAGADWYKFEYDGITGAIIDGNVVTLYLVDGGRGDSDLTIDGNIQIDLGAVSKPFDFDEDGFPDNTQSHLFSMWTGFESGYVTFESPVGTIITAALITDGGAPTAAEGEVADFINGKYSISIVIPPAAEPADGKIPVKLHQLSIPDSYFLYGKETIDDTNHWYEFLYDPDNGANTGAETDEVARIITLHLIDGGLGDSDFVENGEILISVGGPVYYLFDANYDGIADFYQDNVTSIASASSIERITFVSSEGTRLGYFNGTQMTSTIARVDNLQLYSESVEEPSMLSFPDGEIINFFEGIQHYIVSNIDPVGGSTIVTITYPEGVNISSLYLYGPDADSQSKHWYKFTYDASTQTGAVIDGNIVTLYLVDGSRGDADLIVNGEVLLELNGSVISAPLDQGQVDGASGCTIYKHPTNIWHAGSWAIILLFLLFLKIENYQSNRRVTRGKSGMLKISR